MSYFEAAIFGSLAGVAIAIAIAWIRPAKPCPGCGSALPKFQFMSPAERKRLKLPRDGVQCRQCGCVTNFKGQKINHA